MPVEQAPALPTPRSHLLLRVAVVALIAAAVVHGLSVWMKADTLRGDPAGFGRGVLHGAAMPLAWPGLLVGHDSQIYAGNNSGRTYRLGYTTGVNLCGAVFFGMMYRRFTRLRAMVRQYGPRQ